MNFSVKLGKAADAIRGAFSMLGAARDGSVEIRRLMDLPDAELRRRGLSRQDVVRQVFVSRMAAS